MPPASLRCLCMQVVLYKNIMGTVMWICTWGEFANILYCRCFKYTTVSNAKLLILNWNSRKIITSSHKYIYSSLLNCSWYCDKFKTLRFVFVVILIFISLIVIWCLIIQHWHIQTFWIACCSFSVGWILHISTDNISTNSAAESVMVYVNAS